MKHKGLLIGSRASGTIDGSITFANVKGQGTVKTKPIPTYRNTPDQQDTRSDHKDCVILWQTGGLDAGDKIAFDRAAAKDPRAISGFNLFMSTYRIPVASVLTRQIFSVVTAILTTGTWTMAGTATLNTACRAVFYNPDGVYIYEKVFTPATLTFSFTVTSALIGTSGYFRLFNTVGASVGKSGIYPFPKLT